MALPPSNRSVSRSQLSSSWYRDQTHIHAQASADRAGILRPRDVDAVGHRDDAQVGQVRRVSPRVLGIPPDPQKLHAFADLAVGDVRRQAHAAPGESARLRRDEASGVRAAERPERRLGGEVVVFRV